MIWATVSSQSCFCWLYRASPPLDAKHIINLTLVSTIWWCPCVYKSFSHICEIFPLCQISPIVVAVQLLSRVRLFVTPWTVACQASLSFIISLSLLKLMSIKSVMLSNHLILCCPLLLLPSVFPSIRVFFNESALLIRCPNCSSFSFSISLSNDRVDFLWNWLVHFL